MLSVIGFLTVVTPAAVVIAILGGAACGFLIGNLLPPNPVIRTRRTLTYFAIIGFVGAVFFIGQTVEVYLGGDEHWYRTMGRGLLWLIFSGVLSVAATYMQRRHWRI